jgi:hypothetical protein
MDPETTNTCCPRSTENSALVCTMACYCITPCECGEACICASEE